MATATVWHPSQLAYDRAMLVSSITEFMVRWMSKANRKRDDPSSLLIAMAALSSAARAGAAGESASASKRKGAKRRRRTLVKTAPKSRLVEI
jgi:hypothetical protein